MKRPAVTKSSLARGLARGEFWPAFQPLVDLRDNKIVGFEVLARWEHSRHGAIAPSDFIPIAEAKGLIHELAERIIAEACREAAAWPGDFFLAFNISPVQFRSPDLFKRLTETITSHGFPLERAQIEVTESLFIHDEEGTRQTIESFKAAGMALALDDFGTGFSSLSRLHAFPFDKIKIDTSFVRAMEENSGSRKIVTSVIGLGQSLGMTVVAEGVETEQQAEMLRRLGCDVGQGWLFGKPMRAQEARDRLAAAISTGPPVISLVSPFHKIHQLEALYHSAPIGLCFLSLDFTCLSANDRFAQMVGATPAQLVGKDLSDILTSSDSVYIADIFDEVVKGKAAVVRELRPQRGQTTFLMISQRVDDDAGEPVGISVVLLDVTEHRALEHALREIDQHVKFAAALDRSITWSSDAAGTLDYISPTAEYEHLSLAERLSTWSNAIHPDDIGPLRAEWQAWLPSRKDFSATFRLRWDDLEFRWVRSRARPHFGADGQVLRWYGVIHDISYERSLEARIAELEERQAAAREDKADR